MGTLVDKQRQAQAGYDQAKARAKDQYAQAKLSLRTEQTRVLDRAKAEHRRQLELAMKDYLLAMDQVWSETK